MTRDEALEKVRKLLAMATDGRGNVEEAYAAGQAAGARINLNTNRPLQGTGNDRRLAA